MELVHSNISVEVSKPAEKPKYVSKREQRASTWQARQYRKDYDNAVKEFNKEIKEIQKYRPGWMPEFKY